MSVEACVDERFNALIGGVSICEWSVKQQQEEQASLVQGRRHSPPPSLLRPPLLAHLICSVRSCNISLASYIYTLYRLLALNDQPFVVMLQK